MSVLKELLKVAKRHPETREKLRPIIKMASIQARMQKLLGRAQGVVTDPTLDDSRFFRADAADELSDIEEDIRNLAPSRESGVHVVADFVGKAAISLRRGDDLNARDYVQKAKRELFRLV